MGRIGLALLAALLIVTPAQAAAPLTMPAGPSATLYQQWLDTSALPVPVEPITVTLRNCRPRIAACTEHGGITFPDIAYLADTAMYGPNEIEYQRALFLHEVFHVLDSRLAGRGDYRRMFRRILGLPREGARCWSECGFIARSEIAADAYAMCATRPHIAPRDHVYQGYGLYQPTAWKHEVVCHMFNTRIAQAQLR